MHSILQDLMKKIQNGQELVLHCYVQTGGNCTDMKNATCYICFKFSFAIYTRQTISTVFKVCMYIVYDNVTNDNNNINIIRPLSQIMNENLLHVYVYVYYMHQCIL